MRFGLALLLLFALIYWLVGGDDEAAEAVEPDPLAAVVSSALTNGNNTDLFARSIAVSSDHLKA